MTTKRQSPLAPIDRRALILKAAGKLALNHRYDTLTRARIAKAAGVACGTVSHACGPMRAVRDAILRQAIADGSIKIIADGLAARDPIIRSEASDDLKKQALLHLSR